MHGSQSAGTGSLLLLRGTRTVGTLGSGEDSSRGEDEDVPIGEFLFELTGETELC